MHDAPNDHKDSTMNGNLELVHADLSPGGPVEDSATPLAIVRSGCAYPGEPPAEDAIRITALDIATITDLCGEMAQKLAESICALLTDPSSARKLTGVVVTISVKETGHRDHMKT